MSAMVRHPRRTLAAVVFAGVFAGIAGNALFFQTARHPAPIFAGPVIARPMVQQAPMPTPVPRQAEAPAPPSSVAKLSEAAPAQAPAAAVSAPAPVRSAAVPKDEIGALLSASGLIGEMPDNARVLAVQKALVKLGYVLRPDGVMGAGTRQALQMFEQSRKLTVTGDLTPRTLRELGAQSGVSIP